MKTLQLTLVMALGMLSQPSMAMYQCTASNGRVSYQDTPCVGDGVKENRLEIKSPAPATPPQPNPNEASAQPSAPTETQRLRAQSDRLSKERRLHELVELHIPGAQARIRAAANNCDARLKAVRKQKNLAQDNLAGATWEQSISTEMQAIATQCATEQTRFQTELDRLLNEQRGLEKDLKQEDNT